MKSFPIYCALCLFRGPDKGPSTSAPCELCEFKDRPSSFRLDKKVGVKTVSAEIESTNVNELAVSMLVYGSCANCPKMPAHCLAKNFEDCCRILKAYLRGGRDHG